MNCDYCANPLQYKSYNGEWLRNLLISFVLHSYFISILTFYTLSFIYFFQFYFISFLFQIHFSSILIIISYKSISSLLHFCSILFQFFLIQYLNSNPFLFHFYAIFLLYPSFETFSAFHIVHFQISI